MRRITYEEGQFLREILNQSEDPTREEFEKAFNILKEVELYTIQPRPYSKTYRWQEIVPHKHLCINQNSIIVFTNIIDLYRFQVDMLRWDPVMIEEAEMDTWTFQAVVFIAQRMKLNILVDYQPDREHGFLVFDPVQDICYVGVRDE